MTDFFIGDLLTGRRVHALKVLSGSWSDVLNGAGDVTCVVSLKDPVMGRLSLVDAATPGKSFLAAFDGDTGLQGGPVWLHDWDDDKGWLTLTAGGMWSYFDHRALLPVLAGRLPSDRTTDTRFMPQDLAPDSMYPWPTDTRKSLQGIARALVVQAQTETSGNVPVVVPAEIVGANERAYRGSDVAMVGQRLSELTQVIGGPDIKFIPRWKTVGVEVEWLMQIGTPTAPMIASQQQHTFYVGGPKSSVTQLRVRTNGTRLGSRAFSSGGASGDEALVSVSSDSTLVGAGYPLLDLVDSTRSTVAELATLQEYSDELVLAGKIPTRTFTFTHSLSVTPHLSDLATGDFARVRVDGNRYLPDGEYVSRVVAREGDVKGKTVALTFQPSGEFTPSGRPTPTQQWVIDYLNLATNPSFETASGTVEVRRNYALNADAEINVSLWTPESGAALTRETTSPISGSGSFRLGNGGDVYQQAVAAPGDRWTLSLAYKTVGTVAGNPNLYIAFSGGGGAAVQQSLPLTQVAPDRFSVTSIVAPAGTTNVTAAVFAPTAGGFIIFDDVLIEKVPVALPYFAGSSTGFQDMTCSYAGTSGLSASIMSGAGVATVLGSAYSGARGIQSSLWAYQGASSLRIMSVGIGGASNSAVAIPWTFTAGKFYTIGAMYFQNAPQVAPVASLARSMRLIGSTLNGPQATNVAGAQDVRWTFQSAGHTTLQLWNGTPAGEGDSFWDMLTIVEVPSLAEPYTGPLFDGNTPNTPTQRTAWSSAVDASTSTLSTKHTVNFGG